MSNIYKKICSFRSVSRFLFALALFMSAGLAQNYIKPVVLVFTVLGGAYFCGWLCPFGAIQEFIGAIGSRVLGKRYRMPESLHKYLQWLRFILLLLIPLGLGYLIAFDPQHSIISALSNQTLSYALWSIIGIFIILAFFIERPFCNYFCIEGAQYSAFSIARIFTIHRNMRKCIDCHSCDRACSMNIKVSKKKSIRAPNCVNCFKCLAVCPVDALNYGLNLKK